MESEENRAEISSAREVVESICRAMRIDVRFTGAMTEDDSIVLAYSSDETAILIGKRGKTIDALQYISNLIYRRRFPEEKKIVIDLSGYKVKREKMLLNLAEEYIEKAKLIGEYLTEPYSPVDRRIIHMAVKSEDNITSESQGDGRYKRILIKYKI